jgi:hypothetical protein
MLHAFLPVLVAILGKGCEAEVVKVVYLIPVGEQGQGDSLDGRIAPSLLTVSMIQIKQSKVK